MTYVAEIRADDVVPFVPRAEGKLHLVAKRRGRETVISQLRQEGALKALFPKVRGDALDTVFLNTAGGLTGGDQMEIAVTAQEQSHVTVSSQAAERAYKAQPGQIAQTQVRLDIADGGRIDWLPQETILFDCARLNRRMDVELAGSASALLVEPVVFGRKAMGEAVRQLFFKDHWMVRRDGVLIFADAIRMVGDAHAHLTRKAIGSGAGAMATILLASPTASACAADMQLSGNSGFSLIADDLLLVRLLAEDGFELRKQMIPVVEALSTAPIPRVWRL